MSVSDKTGLVEFARALVEEFNVELISTGGTARALRDARLPVKDVSEVTGFPEMMDGRVKTLHPKIHGGLLGRLPEDEPVMREHGIEPIDLVCVNLYPFEQTVAKEGVSYEEAIENIDIGGPSMVRSAAKNHSRVLVVTDPGRYDKVLGDLRKHGGSSCFKHRQKMAARAFSTTFSYDGGISTYLDEQVGNKEDHSYNLHPDSLGETDVFLDALEKRQDLRYGENPHQPAVLYRYDPCGGDLPSLASAEQRHGKELGYINLLDADAALNAVREFERPACCIVKHATPCGVGTGDELARAFVGAHDGDPLAAFGGIVAFNREVDQATAKAISEGNKFIEVIVAPAFDAEAIAILSDRWKNVRLLSVGRLDPFTGPDALTFHQINGGLLVQHRDLVGVIESEWKTVTRRAPTSAELTALKFNWLVCKHVKSNAVVIGGEHGTYGIGGGQVDRVAAAEHAVKKAGERAYGAVAASDAFFPFPDGPQVLIQAGVTAIVQPGGSVRDQATIDLCDAAGVAMVFTGRRHFRH